MGGVWVIVPLAGTTMMGGTLTPRFASMRPARLHHPAGTATPANRAGTSLTSFCSITTWTLARSGNASSRVRCGDGGAGSAACGWGCCRRHASATAAGSPMPPFADGNSSALGAEQVTRAPKNTRRESEDAYAYTEDTTTADDRGAWGGYPGPQHLLPQCRRQAL